jgi:tetratricopeptide (TPR) repeat protein
MSKKFNKVNLDKITLKEKENVDIGDDSNFYWETLNFADELYEQGKYEEAEELYKKIANGKDVYGDSSAHYGYLLDKMGRYEEAFTCFCQALEGDTSPAEGVSVFLDECFCDEDSPYWHYWVRNFDWRLRRYLETCESIGKKPDIKRILLNCLKSKNDLCVSEAIVRLIEIYGTGKYVLDDEVLDVAVPDLEKLKTFVGEVIEDHYDVEDVLDHLCYDPENVDEASANALEAALLAVTFDEVKTLANRILFSLYLFGMATYTDEKIQIDVPSLQNRHKALEFMSMMDFDEVFWAVLTGYNEDYEKLAEFLEEAHRIYPDDDDIAISLLLNVKTARLPELISNLSDNCAQKLNSDFYDNSLVGLMDGGVGIEDAEEFEAYYMSLLVFFTKYKMPDEFCSDIQKLLLSAYQFGEYLNYASKYEISELEDHQKATEFAEKYGIELLSEPFDI